jgi:hypothetical protein
MTARRTLGCWILSAFLQRGCDPTRLRTRRVVWSVRPLSASEAAALHPLVVLSRLALPAVPAFATLPAGRASRGFALVALSNLRRMPHPLVQH